MICPICGRIFDDGYRICPHCEVDLIESDPREMDTPDLASQTENGSEKTAPSCLVCGGKAFVRKTGYLSYHDSGLFRLAGEGEETVNFICKDCGYVLTFIDQPSQFRKQSHLVDNFGTEIDYETSEAGPDECPLCFSEIRPGDRECSNCGRKLS